MEARGHGRIVMIGTGAAKTPAEIRLLSGPARSALCNYVMAISKRLIKSDVTINNVLPGMFHTASIAERFGALAQENGTTYEEECTKFAREWNIPSEQFGDPEDVGAFTAFLCSKYAGYISGQSILIDGGISRSLF
ncbi:MAG: SDR family oxidoreductase [Pseudomonadota bacterium]